MRRFEIGSYTYFVYPHDRYSMTESRRPSSDLDDRVKSYDNMLHQSLDKIFRRSSSGQIKKFLLNPQLKSIIKPILEQETILSEHFSKEEMGKLSLLWIAVLCGYEKSAELLVRSGADVNELFGRHYPQIMEPNRTILHLLLKMECSPENELLFRLVMDQGAELEARDHEGRTVLHVTVNKGRVQMTEMLLERGANVNVVDRDHMTPLLLAASNSNRAKELLPLLMNYGADVFARNRSGENILHYLARTVIRGFSIGDLPELARVFIEEGASLDDKENRDHRQPIHFAVQHRKTELVKFYLDHGANVNALTKSSRSPLYMAAERGNMTEVEILVKRGANVDLRTLKGRTALHAFCRYIATDLLFGHEEDCESTIRELLCAGADVLAEDREGKTPLALISSRVDRRQPGDESWPLIETLALKKALQPSIELKDERIIERYPKLRDYYRECNEEIDKMKSTRFIKTCTFFQLLAKCRCQIAALMRNPEFETNFKQYDLNGEFPIYARDIVQAFERALDHYNSLLEQEDLIYEAFYNRLPYLVVNKIAYHIFDCCGNVK